MQCVRKKILFLSIYSKEVFNTPGAEGDKIFKCQLLSLMVVIQELVSLM